MKMNQQKSNMKIPITTPKKDKSKANFTIVLHSLKKKVYLGESVRVSM